LPVYRAAAQSRLRALLADSEIRLRMYPNDLQAWLEQGEFETMHGRGRTSGHQSLPDRRKVEAKVLGVREDACSAARPRYGYARGSCEDAKPINLFGQILVRLHESERIREKASVMLGDSMGSTNVGEFPCIAPAPLRAPALTCRFSSAEVVRATSLEEACDPCYLYAEVQIYTPLYPDDIKQVVFCGGLAMPVDLSLLLNRLGIEHDHTSGYQV
jgi:hypothetical protein